MIYTILKKLTSYVVYQQFYNDDHVQRNNYNVLLLYLSNYEGCSKRIAYFYLETSNFKLAQKFSFHAIKELSVARNAKLQPMYPLLEGVTVS